jgi:ABC-type branched-subunit amino acid transport system substrate-binding protein
MVKRYRVLLPGLVVAIAVFVTACGSSSSSSSSSGTPAATSSTTAAAGTAKSPSGPPILLGSLCGLSGPVVYTECKTVATAVENQVNSEGGIQGRPLKYNFCDINLGDPSAAPNCVRSFVDNSNMLATTGNLVDYGLGAAAAKVGLVDLSPYTGDLSDFTAASSTTFVYSCPDLCYTNALMRLAKQHGGKSFVFTYFPQPQSASEISSLTTIAKQIGIAFHAIQMNPTTPTFSAYATVAKSYGADWEEVQGGVPQFTSVIQANTQIGLTPHYVFNQGMYDQQVLNKAPSVLNGAIFLFYVPPFNDPRLAPLKQLMAKYEPGVSWDLNYQAIESWVSAVGMVKALQSIPKGTAITRASVLAAVKQLDDTNPALAEPEDFAKLPGPCSYAPNAPADKMFLMQVKDHGAVLYQKNPVTVC